MGMTKIEKKIRVMRKYQLWFSLNKSTPDAWFDRWETFVSKLMLEIGFAEVSISPLDKPRGKAWSKGINFDHPRIGSYRITLQRKRSQEGGSICLEKDTKLSTIETANQVTPGTMCRTTAGNQILDTIRKNWEWEQLEPTNQEI